MKKEAERIEHPDPKPESTESENGQSEAARGLYVCDRCGFAMVETQCKVVCPNCGSRYDCSDLNIYFD